MVAVCLFFAAALPGSSNELVVGIHDKAPFAFQDKSGAWTGMSVELWEAIAKENNWEFRYEEMPAGALIPALAGSKVDLVLGEILVNSEDEKVMTFSQPFLKSSVGVAVSVRHWHQSWLHILIHAFDWTLLRVFLYFVPILLGVSFLIWLIERRRVDGHFGGKPAQGIGAAFWFSAVTMTSTGYGDKVPVTFLGRLLSVVWMFLSLLLVTAFTASVASTVATVRNSTIVHSPADLVHYRNGIEGGGVAEKILNRYSAPTVSFDTYEDALQKLSNGAVDTVVGDSTSLRYLIRKDYARILSLLPMRLFSSRIAFGLPQESSLLEPLNVSLLDFIHSPRWADVLKKYLASTELAPVDATHPPQSKTP